MHVSKESPAVLVVEDNPTNQLLLQQQLAYIGIEATMAKDGKEALTHLVEPGKYDILLTDINMPDMDGYELAMQIRTSMHAQVAQIPIIAITANATHEDKKKCLASGMNDFLPKPVDLNALRDMIERILAKGKVIKPETIQIKDQAESLSETRQADILDVSAVSDFVGGDKGLILKLFNAFLKQTPEIIQDIHCACRDNDMKKVAFNTHKLKSSARSMGSARLADLCVAMESAAKRHDNEAVNAMDETLDNLFNETRAAIVKYSE